MAEKKSSKTVIFSVIFLVAGLVAGYLLGAYVVPKNSSRSFNPGDNGNFRTMQQFQINQSAQDEVTTFFSSAQDQDDVDSYCTLQENAPSCFYYCRNINPQNQYCASLAAGGQMMYRERT